MVDEGVIAPADIEIFRYVETAEEAWEILKPVIEAVAARPGRARRGAAGGGAAAAAGQGRPAALCYAGV